MIYIETNSTKPYINLAFEEYFLKNHDLGDDIFMLWQNEPTIVVGRFQNTLQEVNQAYTDAHHIHLIRRITGGGAVYHDLGNLCYTFILNGITPDKVDVPLFARPVVNALAKFGIHAEASGRNDLTLDGKKFSGTAMALQKKRLLFHGTLMYDTDLTVLSEALNVAPDKIASKGVKSVRSRVTNIKPYAPTDLTIEQFKEALKQSLFGESAQREYHPTPEDLAAIQELSIKKYQSWEWNFGSNPSAGVVYSKRFTGGKLEIHLNIEKGLITSCNIRGDFLGLCEAEEVEQRLTGIPYREDAILQAMQDVDMKKHFGTITLEEFLTTILGK
jgi:lipoate-protein ligase A